MSNVNDSKIMTLKAQIEEKRKKLDSISKFVPITNLSIEFEGERYNLNVLQKEQLISLLVKLNCHKLSAQDLGLLDEYIISGYKLEDWITDVRGKLDIASRKDEERKLKIMENKLDKMLSDDKKIELELEDIANLLKE